MPGSSSNSSFIPKRGTSKHKRRVRSGNVYLFTIISYMLIFGALIASGAVFFYASVVNGQLQEEITAMNSAVNKFNQADLLRVQEFDARLAQAQNRLDNAGSVVAILEAVEAATIGTVRFSKFELERDYDNSYIVDAQLETDTFDSAIFQRTITEGNDVISEAEFFDVSIQTSVTEEESATVGQSLSLAALMMVPIAAVPPQTITEEDLNPFTEQPAEVLPPVPEALPESDSVSSPEEGVVDEVVETDVIEGSI